MQDDIFLSSSLLNFTIATLDNQKPPDVSYPPCGYIFLSFSPSSFTLPWIPLLSAHKKMNGRPPYFLVGRAKKTIAASLAWTCHFFRFAFSFWLLYTRFFSSSSCTLERAGNIAVDRPQKSSRLIVPSSPNCSKLRHYRLCGLRHGKARSMRKKKR